jgi:hypothetical protein
VVPNCDFGDDPRKIIEEIDNKGGYFNAMCVSEQMWTPCVSILTQDSERSSPAHAFLSSSMSRRSWHMTCSTGIRLFGAQRRLKAPIVKRLPTRPGDTAKNGRREETRS